MLHITPRASAYIENFWAWLADHDIDDPDWTDDNNDMVSEVLAQRRLINATDIRLDPSKRFCCAGSTHRKYRLNLALRYRI